MIFDTHTHYDDEAFDTDREEVIGSFKENNVGKFICVSADIKSCYEIPKMVIKYDNSYGAVGIHPSDVDKLNDDNFKDIVIDNVSKDRIIAIGEIGLDYYDEAPDKKIQIRWFERQLELAKELNKPVIIHSRDAAKDTLDIIRNNKMGEQGGSIHCFSYGVEIAREYLDMGFYLGIGGVLTFKNARKLKEVVEFMPLDRILLETDCPYLAPVPFRGKRNNSAYLSYVVEAICDIKGADKEKVEKITWDNAVKAFRL
ncbi:MAG: TatD family hydrolase [Lachnospiraceae bacterium]|nr:TatD family hydrolase [Lachnospiraceae bacterium]